MALLHGSNYCSLYGLRRRMFKRSVTDGDIRMVLALPLMWTRTISKGPSKRGPPSSRLKKPVILVGDMTFSLPYYITLHQLHHGILSAELISKPESGLHSSQKGTKYQTKAAARNKQGQAQKSKGWFVICQSAVVGRGDWRSFLW